jgi:hypothetical protein
MTDDRRSASAADRLLMKRLSIAVAVIFLVMAAYARLDLLYSKKFFNVTGHAQWIWDPHELIAEEPFDGPPTRQTGKPIAFFAAHDFELPQNRYYTKIKIVGDPQYMVWFNGKEIGGREVGEEAVLDEYDVTPLARTGANRIVVALRSTNGVGGLIAAVDISPETENYVVTGRDWKIFRRWSDDLTLRDPPSFHALRPQLLGEPPLRRWNYLSVQPGKPADVTHEVVAPRGSFPMATALPEVMVVGGVAITVPRPTHATVFDFGPTFGRLRLRIRQPSPVSRLVDVRFSNLREELTPVEGSVTPFVFAPGERVIIDPETRYFRYAMVYGDSADVDVVR